MNSFALLERRQGVDHRGHHRHRPDPLALRHLLPAAGEVAPDVEQTVDEVDVAPAQRQQLALAQAGEGGHPVDRGVLVVVGGDDRQLDLVAVEGVELARVGDLGPLDQVGGGRVLRRPQTRFARLKMPCRTVRWRTMVRLDSFPSAISRSL